MTLTSWSVLRLSVAAFIVFVAPLIDRYAANRLRSHSEGPNRRRFYRNGMISLWLSGALCTVLIPGHSFVRLPPSVLADLGALGPLWFKVVLACVTISFFIVLLRSGAKCLYRPTTRAAYTKALERSPLGFMMPRGVNERRLWAGLAVAAGICEEICFRGFLMSVAHEELRLSLLAALLITSIAFGCAHLYQGFAGILQAGVTGLMLGFAALLTGGFLLPFVFHSLVDLQILAMFRPQEAELGALQQSSVS